MTAGSSLAAETASPAPSVGAEPNNPPAATPEPSTYSGTLPGLREAAVDVKRKRDEEGADAPDPAELERARGELARRQSDRKADADRRSEFARRIELGGDESLNPLEAAELLAFDRRSAREIAEAELSEILEQSRQTEPETAERQPQQPQQPDPRQQAAALQQRDRQFTAALTRQAAQLSAEHKKLVAEVRSRFADIAALPTETAKIEALAALPPERQRVWQELDAKRIGLETADARLNEQRVRYDQWRSGETQAAQRASFEAWGAEQDKQAAKAIPELANGGGKALQDETRAYLVEIGLSEREIAWRWANDPTFRSVQAQRLMADAVRGRLARKQIEASRVKPPPPKVQRPGPARGHDPGRSELITLDERLARTGKLKDAAALLTARRKAAARGR